MSLLCNIKQKQTILYCTTKENKTKNLYRIVIRIRQKIIAVLQKQTILYRTVMEKIKKFLP